ncbi:uncharacterized protein LOC135376902 [Ornithodoros turicata]|uniref:uncharacterized protein LOC135376902 n=1 Tax=Ornithodoros turicata TaxID=34597 RepID=UPI003139BD67
MDSPKVLRLLLRPAQELFEECVSRNLTLPENADPRQAAILIMEDDERRKHASTSAIPTKDNEEYQTSEECESSEDEHQDEQASPTNKTSKKTPTASSSAPITIDQLAEIFKQVVSTPQRIVTTPDLSQTLKFFYGRPNDDFRAWLSSIDVLRIQYGWDDYTALAIAKSKLRGAAKDWDDGSGRSCVTWQDWVKGLKEQFDYHPDLPDWNRDCEARVQKSEESISDYIHAKIKILCKCPYQLRERDKIRYITMGLQSEATRTSLTSYYMSTGCDCLTLIKLARQIEPSQKHRDPNWRQQGAKPKDYTKKEHQRQQGFSSTSQPKYSSRQNGEKHSPTSTKTSDKSSLKYKDPKDYTKHQDKDKKHSYTASIRHDLPSRHPVRPVIEILVDNTPVDALVDTGADISILRKQEAELWGINIKPWSDSAMIAVDNESMPFGEAVVEVKLANTTVSLQVAIVTNIIYPFILGSDWRTSAKLGITVWPNGHVSIQSPPKSHQENIFNSMFLKKDFLQELSPSHAEEFQPIQERIFYNTTSKDQDTSTDIKTHHILHASNNVQVNNNKALTSTCSSTQRKSTPRNCPFPLLPGTNIVAPQDGPNIVAPQDGPNIVASQDKVKIPSRQATSVSARTSSSNSFPANSSVCERVSEFRNVVDLHRTQPSQL